MSPSLMLLSFNETPELFSCDFEGCFQKAEFIPVCSDVNFEDSEQKRERQLHETGPKRGRAVQFFDAGSCIVSAHGAVLNWSQSCDYEP